MSLPRYDVGIGVQSKYLQVSTLPMLAGEEPRIASSLALLRLFFSDNFFWPGVAPSLPVAVVVSLQHPGFDAQSTTQSIAPLTLNPTITTRFRSVVQLTPSSEAPAAPRVCRDNLFPPEGAESEPAFMSSPPWDFIAKLLTVRLCEGRFTTTHDVTIGVEFGSRIVPVGPPASDEIGINFDNTSLSSSPSALSPTTSFIGNNSQSANKNGKSASEKSVPPSPRSLSGLPPPPTKPSEPPVQKRMKLSLWDTAGQETYKSITRSYFRGASGALLVFDITRPPTFASLTQWLQDLRQIAEERIVVILVGNKSDLVEDAKPDSSKGKERETDNPDTNTDSNTDNDNKKQRVTREEAEEWCRLNNVVRYVETSAKSGEGVERAFREVAERIYRNIQYGKYDLNDRRSGVKGYGASAGPGNGRVPRTVNLGVNDAMRRGNRGWTGGCC
ncbi:uncharacterized protein GIQ15_02902 [Arthroderma uncinatum]|uniref:uncharacterized protein n=1 Tax=Arthroderma uncinatum TaxID=74035 RepID=UPI00144AF46F|nr:uncharacterized protein GIQ15_02902 [Arthroderma uncinatum]KAF3483578.1 hypothetical protein GIQ15_02902 [Arthroderma uncinatum]